MESESQVHEVEPVVAPPQVAGAALAPAAPGGATLAARVLALNRGAGNAAVARAIADGRIEPSRPGIAGPVIGRQAAPAAPPTAAPATAVPTPPVDGAVELSHGPIGALLEAIEGWNPRDQFFDAYVATPGVDGRRMDLAEKVVFWKESGVDEDAAVDIAQDLYVLGATLEERDAVFTYLGLSGLALPSNLEAFASDAKSAAAAIATMGTFEERAEKVRGVINARLQAANIPTIGPITAAGGGDAHFDKGGWTVTVDKEFAMKGDANAPAALLTAVYHEARHAEQDFLLARRMARTMSAEEIATAHGVPPRVAQAAKDQPLAPDDPQNALVDRLEEPIDMTPDPELARIRPTLIEKKKKGEPFTPEEQAVLDRAYARYRARPHEADAFMVATLAELEMTLGPP